MALAKRDAARLSRRDVTALRLSSGAAGGVGALVPRATAGRPRVRDWPLGRHQSASEL